MQRIIYTQIKEGWIYRWYKIKWQFQSYLNGGNPSGHSLTQRMEYWKNGYHVLRGNWFFGVGLGDAGDAMRDQYVKDNSVLKIRWRLVAHNQYLTIATQIGLIGLSVVLTCFFLLFRMGLRKRATIFVLFLLVMCISMLFEDTFISQAGSTLFGFGGFLLFASKDPI